MTSEDRPRGEAETAPQGPLDRAMARAVGRARLVALFEVAWRRAMPALWVCGLHVALAWLGVYAALPLVLRFVLLGCLALLLLAALVHGLRGRADYVAALDRRRATARVEAASGLRGHELIGLSDRLSAAADPITERLWAAHRARLAARVGRLASGWPQPDLGRRDVWALRPILGLALFVGWFAAGDDRLGRLTSPFAVPVQAVPEDRIDAWIDPPAYTGRAPVVLLAEGRRVLAAGEPGEVLSVPQGSRLLVRSAAAAGDRPPRPLILTVTPKGGTARDIAPTPLPEGTPATTPVERVATLGADGTVRLVRDGTTLADWRITVQPDLPPTIRLVGAPEPQASGALKFSHETADDWGVVAAEARFQPVEAPRGRPLYSPPSFPLSLPLGRGHIGPATTIRDVTAHPHAGATMRMTLVARDEAGQEGVSESVEVRLPERPFRKPLARSLAELRRRLALDAGEASTVVTALDALTLAPERFDTSPAAHLGLRFALRRAAEARDDAALREVVDLLWAAATAIEDGDLADAEKALRQAQEALRKALEEGASPDEISRLTRELRQAMEKYLASKAEQARREPQRRTEQTGPRRTVTDRDLQKMLDRIEALARTGSREAAEKLLQELREMMENLEAGGSSSRQGDGQAAGEALEKLGDMIRRQQKLMEDTHRADRGEGEEGAEDGTGEMGRIGEGQKELRDTLRRFSEEMRGRGAGEGRGEGKGEGRGTGGDDDGSDELNGAADSMGEAGEALGRGEGEEALDAQTRALEQLRKGARKLADRMMRQGGGGREGQEAGDEDPLGRPRRSQGPSFSDKVKVPEEIDVERARRILEDIRRRLGEPARPKFERDYLDRLLNLDR